jgi:hypothetical protein
VKIVRDAGITEAMSRPRHYGRREHPIVEGVVLWLMMTVYRPKDEA